MADKFRHGEQALRRLPLPYSLALRLRDAGVAADVICQYVNVERAALDGVYRIAEAKFVAALQKTEIGESPGWQVSSTEAETGRDCRGGLLSASP